MFKEWILEGTPSVQSQDDENEPQVAASKGEGKPEKWDPLGTQNRRYFKRKGMIVFIDMIISIKKNTQKNT